MPLIWLLAFFGLLAALLVTGCASLPAGPEEKHFVHNVRKTFSGRSDGLVLEDDYSEEWKSRSFTRGEYFFTDPKASSLCLWHTPQPGLAGSTRVMAGDLSIVVDSNLVPVITAGGTAAGNAAAAFGKKAIGIP